MTFVAISKFEILEWLQKTTTSVVVDALGRGKHTSAFYIASIRLEILQHLREISQIFPTFLVVLQWAMKMILISTTDRAKFLDDFDIGQIGGRFATDFLSHFIPGWRRKREEKSTSVCDVVALDSLLKLHCYFKESKAHRIFLFFISFQHMLQLRSMLSKTI